MNFGAEALQQAQEYLQTLGLPEEFTMQAMMYVLARHNLTPFERGGTFEAPITRALGKPPNKDCLQPFGCLVEYKTPKGATQKAVFLGVDIGMFGEKDPPAFNVYDPKTKREKQVAKVEFFPNKFPMRDGFD